MKSLKFPVLLLLAFGLVACAYARNTETAQSNVENDNGMLGNSVLPRADYYLKYQKNLNLNGNQIKALQNVRLDLTKKTSNTQAQIDVSQTELTNMLETDPVDLKNVEKKVQEIEKLRSGLNLAGIDCGVAARKILTPEQRKKAESLNNSSIKNETRVGIQNYMDSSMGGF